MDIVGFIKKYIVQIFFALALVIIIVVQAFAISNLKKEVQQKDKQINIYKESIVLMNH